MPNPSFSQQDFQEQLNQPDNHAFIQSLKQYSTADLADILMGLPINDQIRLLEQLPQASFDILIIRTDRASIIPKI
jgi:magnesium transporter